MFMIAARRARNSAATVLAASAAASLLAVVGPSASASASPVLYVRVGYMDTHSAPTSSKQPSPWPYTSPSRFVGTPCPNFGSSTGCWDAGAVRLDNPGTTAVTGVKVVVVVANSSERETYSLWGSSLTVRAGSMLVLTETGSTPNSGNFDLSDEPPNAYNGGNYASCANSGAIPKVKVTIGGVTTTYHDAGQVLNTGGADARHCLNGTYTSQDLDESHPWVRLLS